MKETDDRVGQRIRARRRDLDKSLREVAGLAGISHSTLLRIEKGDVSAANRFQLARIAQALKCPVDVLTGVVVPGGPDKAAILAATYDSVHALLNADLDFEPPPRPDRLDPIEALTARVDQLIDLRQRCDYATLARRLPILVQDLYAATTGPHRPQALTMLVRVAEAASFAVRYLGDPRSATIASERARQAAGELGDPVMISFGDWARAHSALGCGLHERAALIAGKAIRELAAAPAGPGRLEMLGMLHLTHAFALVGAGRAGDAQSPLQEADRLAEQTGETDTLALMFGPTNVNLWRLAMLTDGTDERDTIDALPLISSTDPSHLPQTRQVCFYTDAARLLVRAGDTDRAVRFFETAEGIAPQRMHGDPIIIESVRDLVEQAHRRALSTRLRGLASRVGVPA